MLAMTDGTELLRSNAMNAEGIMLAVGAVIRDAEGRLLLVRHKRERGGYWQGKWICPGGRLEPGETLAEGALREVREETHLDIKLGKILAPFETIVREGDTVRLHVVYVDFLADLVGGELKPDDDIAEAEWWDQSTLARRWYELHHDTQRLLTIAGCVPELPSSSLQ
ncbi:MAG: NUDIX domain-containing protein [Candidatus Abyssobacteria bacterium SURF_17]|uniref:NUDIX domain-containing protein n=1 Tax=Candidatus Abyssobacteria bacterium SURF_17 TaxID=2093361 RepID=A0A419EXG4_9BACT|nr:MAG: NUDIX domain-containing protein [Candidatus Abyssubacteria bacterium SURF_17]